MRGAHRFLGTVAGLAVAAVLLVLPLPALVVLVIVAALQGAAELVVGRNDGLALVFVTPLALLLGQLADPQPTSQLIVARLIETALGIGVGVAVAVLTRERTTAPT